MATATAEAPRRTEEGSARKPESMVDYLLRKEWKPLGDPHDQNTYWMDPTKPVRDEWKKEPKMYDRLVRDENGRPLKDEQGRERTERVPIMAQFGLGVAEKRPVVQHVHIPAAEPMLYNVALAEQKRRDMIEEYESAKKAAKK